MTTKFTSTVEKRIIFPDMMRQEDIYISDLLPLTARVTEITIKYKTITREQMIKEFNERDLARHDAAVKANVTRKIKKGVKQS